MSEEKASYDGQGIPLTVEAFKNRRCGLGIEHQDFVLPTPQEIKSLRNLLRFTQIDLAKLTGVKWTREKGSSAVRKWETTEGKEMRSISPSAWQLMLLKAGLITIEPVKIKMPDH